MDAEKRVVGATWRARRCQATALIRVAEAAEVWHDLRGVPYATVRDGAAVHHLEVASGRFRQWLARAYYSECGGAPSAGAVREAVSFVAARASFGAATRQVYLRVARTGSGLVVDLGDPSAGAILVSAEGVSHAPTCDVAFRRPPGMAALPIPELGGSLRRLRRFINVADDDWPLVAGWLLAAVRPEGPFPVLFLHGEQGCGKSTQARVLRALIDPNSAPLRAQPRDLHDLAVSAHNSWVLAFDNLSTLPAWLSDAFCRLSTGGGFATRALYANDAEVVLDAQRPVLVTGIEDLAMRSDLLDRSLVVHLPLLPDVKRRAESAFWDEFNVVRPSLVGALAEAASLALREHPNVRLPALPRLADFVTWAEAAAPAFGCVRGDFEALYRRRAAEHHVAAVDASALARPLVRLAMAGGWRGTATELLLAVEAVAGHAGTRGGAWPRALAQFSGAVRRLAPNLRAVGVHVSFEREDGTGRRLIALGVSDPGLVLAAGSTIVVPLQGQVAPVRK